MAFQFFTLDTFPLSQSALSPSIRPVRKNKKPGYRTETEPDPFTTMVLIRGLWAFVGKQKDSRNLTLSATIRLLRLGKVDKLIHVRLKIKNVSSATTQSWRNEHLNGPCFWRCACAEVENENRLTVLLIPPPSTTQEDHQISSERYVFNSVINT